MYTVIVEIRAAEGGADAKDLVLLQAGIYLKYAAMQKLLWEPLETRPGFLSARLSGPADILKRFSQSEPGGHRWQRVPPTERKGRVHTSTITTSVLREPTQAEVHLNPGDLEWKTTRSGGPGGQHANKQPPLWFLHTGRLVFVCGLKPLKASIEIRILLFRC